ncbi:DUF1963 domain-containing protein [Streptomyces sp. NRRL S-813]|uniref:DUF1963 domain-containing protein n=1 Tax=Streptomyces sp. NRRL S-813 TaxID=1463919 RepID=UPI00131B9A92|nr:YwqG family protein [Streptomyces sp. NRRL S-813]
MRSMEPFRDEALRLGIPQDEVERWLGTIVRPCASLVPGKPTDGPVAGRLGGLPPMPEDEPVPNLPFLASVDLAAIPPGATDLPLPKEGTLLFFAETSENAPYGDDRDWSRLVYVPAGRPVAERGPGGERPPKVYPGGDLRVVIDPSLPNRGDHIEGFPHSDELGEVWWDTYYEMQTGGLVQIGGYPWVENNDPVLDIGHGPGDWVLLAEIGSAVVEGDMGRVYWVIRRDDLAAGRFTQARAEYDMTG